VTVAPPHGRFTAPWPVEPPGPPVWERSDASWIVSRHADVEKYLRSDDFKSPDASTEVRLVAARAGIDVTATTKMLDTLMLMRNGEEHRALRSAFAFAMPKLLARWPRERLRETTQRIVGGLSTGTMDVVPSLVDALPNEVAADLLGLSPKDVGWLAECNTELMAFWRPAAPLRIYRRIEAMAREAWSFLENHPRDSSRIELPVSDRELHVGFEFFLCGATIASTSGTIGGAICLLAAHPALQDTLAREPGRVGAFVDEAFRLVGGARRGGRRVSTRAVEIDGVTMAEGTGVLFDLERAGRDPSVYADPDVVDFDRPKVAGVAFGAGARACMGPALARAEIVVLLQTLLQRFAFRAAGDPVLSKTRNLRVFRTLPITIESRA
jgi:cytochrome P450